MDLLEFASTLVFSSWCELARHTISSHWSGFVHSKELAELVSQNLRLVDRDQGAAVVDPNQL